MGAGYKLTPAGAQKRFPLLMPTLDGLTKYAHLIDVEYFADLLQVSTTTQVSKHTSTVAMTSALQCCNVGVGCYVLAASAAEADTSSPIHAVMSNICGIFDIGLQAW